MLVAYFCIRLKLKEQLSLSFIEGFIKMILSKSVLRALVSNSNI